MSNTYKIVIALIVVAALGFFGYQMFGSSPTATTTPDTSSTYVPAGQDILVLVAKLQNISINQTIFSSPLFSSLVDFSTAIFPEQQGRPNPFAPIGSDLSSPTLNIGNQKQTSGTNGQ